MLNSYYIKCWFFLVVINDYRCVTHCGSSIDSFNLHCYCSVSLYHVLHVGDFDCSVLPIVGRPATIK